MVRARHSQIGEETTIGNNQTKLLILTIINVKYELSFSLREGQSN
jgi:hypothetical protein